MAEAMKVMGATVDEAALAEIPKPAPDKGEVRVKVVASSVNPGEEKVISGDFVGRFLHARTSPLVLGWDFSGTVDALGEGVADLQEGTAVWGHLAFSSSQKQGAFAEYITISREEIAVKPDKVPHHMTAASATVTMTALQSLRDEGELAEGKNVLIVGAAGGIGSVAVGIAKRLGAHVTAICSTKDVDRVTALGADTVIDRKKSDPLAANAAYDLVFDTPGVYSFGQCAKVIGKGGAYVTTMPGASLFAGMIHALLTGRRCRFVQVASKRADLELVGNWLSEGLEVPIDSRHRVADLNAALKRQNDRDRSGRVVVDVADGWPS